MSRDFHYIRLGVNIDHVATVRQARGGDVPDPVAAALLAERGGADGITVHLREDRRHIQERDVELLRRKIGTKLNLEIALNSEIMEIALRARPDDVCLVPERREELTTEGGLDVARQKARVKEAVARFQGNGIRVSLFVDPEALQVEASGEIGAHGIELHTGRYCNATESRGRELEHLIAAASQARGLGLEVHAGHGLSLENVAPVAGIPEIVELNIGHSIIARAIMVGIEHAVREMKELLTEARASVSIIPR